MNNSTNKKIDGNLPIFDSLYGRIRDYSTNTFRYMSADKIWGNGNPKTNGEQWFFLLIKPSVKLLFDVGLSVELTFPDDGKTIQHCFEPLMRDYSRACQFKSNTVIINNLGLGSKPGTFKYYAHSTSLMPRAHYKCKVDCSCLTTVDVTTLDLYCEKNNITGPIDFIKIDTEGYELEVIKGARKSLQNTKFVQFEYGGTYPDANITLLDVYKELRSVGFNYFYLIGPDYLLLQETPIENCQYSNYVATKIPIHELLVNLSV
jgi:FkbM family methyltransferase